MPNSRSKIGVMLKSIIIKLYIIVDTAQNTLDIKAAAKN